MSRVRLSSLHFRIGTRLLLVPKPGLIFGPSAQIPSLDQETLSSIHIVLILQFFDPYSDSIFAETDVFGLHFV